MNNPFNPNPAHQPPQPPPAQPNQPPAHVLRNMGAPTGTDVGPGGNTMQLKQVKGTFAELTRQVRGLAGNPNDPDAAACKSVNKLVEQLAQSSVHNQYPDIKRAYRALLSYLPKSQSFTRDDLLKLSKALAVYGSVVNQH
jgi:hypothetical protein